VQKNRFKGERDVQFPVNFKVTQKGKCHYLSLKSNKTTYGAAALREKKPPQHHVYSAVNRSREKYHKNLHVKNTIPLNAMTFFLFLFFF